MADFSDKMSTSLSGKKHLIWWE